MTKGTALAAIAAFAAGLLVLKAIQREKQGAPAVSSQGTPQTASSQSSHLPQDRPGPVDQGGETAVLAFPLGMAPKDVADYFASIGRPHDAGPIINIYQGGTSSVSETPLPDTNQKARRTIGWDASGAALDGSIPASSLIPPEKPTPEPLTHQNIWGQTQAGPPDTLETVGKPALSLGGGLLAESLGTTAGLAAQRASGAKTVGELKAAGSLAGPVAAGVGVGIQGAQILQDVGFFDQVVKPAGAASSEALGPAGSKAAATLALPLAVPGAAVKALVTPGESVVGNIRTAAEKSFIPDAVAGAKAAGGAIVEGASAVGGAFVETGKSLKEGSEARIKETKEFFNGLIQGKWF